MLSNQKKQAVARMLQGGGRKPDSFLPANGGSDNLQLLRAFGNPIFDAQFDLKVSIKYCTVSGGVFTEIAAAALNATLKTKLPVFMFGHTDQSSGFAKLQSVYPVNVWNYGNMFVYGYNLATTAFGDCDATANAFFTKGDVVLPFYATTAGPVTTVAFVILSSSNVAYATLLDALSSDMFAVNMVRYTIADALVAQYNNTIGVYDLTLFGKFKSDTVNPLAFKQPDQQQVGIVDITIEQPIDKNIAWALYVNYDAIAFTFQVFAKGVDKLRY